MNEQDKLLAQIKGDLVEKVEKKPVVVQEKRGHTTEVWGETKGDAPTTKPHTASIWANGQPALSKRGATFKRG